MTRVIVPSAVSQVPSEEKVAYVMMEILKMRSFPKIAKMLQQNYDMSFFDAQRTYKLAFEKIKYNSMNGITQLPTREMYYEALLETRERCILKEDTVSEVRILVEIGDVLGLNHRPEEIDAAVIDPDIERKKKERLQELLEKHKLTSVRTSTGPSRVPGEEVTYSAAEPGDFKID